MTDYSLYKKDGKLIVIADDKNGDSTPENRLAIDDFLCCGPTAWRIRKKESDSEWVNNPLGEFGEPYLNPNCANATFETIVGRVERLSFGRKRKILKKIPESVTFETATHHFSDFEAGAGIEKYYCHMPDNPEHKIYLEMDFVQGPCFPADRNPPEENGVKKSCIRVSPDYMRVGGDLVLNNKATYKFTVQQTSNNGDLNLPENDPSPCANDTNLVCSLTKTKYIEYDIERTINMQNDQDPLFGILKCCATNPRLVYGMEDEIKTGYVICPSISGSVSINYPNDAVIGDKAHDDDTNEYRQTTWTEKLVLEVLIMDRDGNNDIWVPVMDGDEPVEIEATYIKKCWSKGTPSNPKIKTISIPIDTDIEDPDSPSCGDNKIYHDYLSHPPCLVDN